MEIRRLSRTGGSLSLSLPKPYCQLLGLTRGSNVAVSMPDKHTITITTLDHYMRQGKEDNIYVHQSSKAAE